MREVWVGDNCINDARFFLAFYASKEDGYRARTAFAKEGNCIFHPVERGSRLARTGSSHSREGKSGRDILGVDPSAFLGGGCGGERVGGAPS
jgi:hypothetical protein